MTNHIGPFVLSALLLDVMNPEGKVINVSSKLHTNLLLNDENFENISKNYSFMTMYGLSKLGNVYHARHLDQYSLAKGLNIKTASLHPGVVNSNIWDQFSTNICLKITKCIIYPFLWLFTKDTKMGAQTTLHIAYMENDQLISGSYFNNCKVEKLNKLPGDTEQMNKFMTFTKDLIFKNMETVPAELSIYFQGNIQMNV